MDPVTVDLTDVLRKLLESGGSAATVGIVWIAFKLKAAVEGYLKTLNETLAKLTDATTQLSIELKRLQYSLDRMPPPPVSAPSPVRVIDGGKP